MTADEKQRLDEQGYLTIENLMGSDFLEELRGRVDKLFRDEGDHAGGEFRQEPNTRRLANLVDKGEVFQRLIAHPTVLACIAEVLGPAFKLSSLNARSANPHSASGQPLHADMGAIADDRGYWVCNTVWLLDDFTPANGSLRVVPGSHRWRKLPQDVLTDLNGAHPDEVLVTGKAGTVVVMNAHLWHGGTDNGTERERRALHAFYCRIDKPQQQYQKKLLRPETAAGLSPGLRRLLALDDARNDDLSSQVNNPSGFLR